MKHKSDKPKLKNNLHGRNVFYSLRPSSGRLKPDDERREIPLRKGESVIVYLENSTEQLPKNYTIKFPKHWAYCTNITEAGAIPSCIFEEKENPYKLTFYAPLMSFHPVCRPYPPEEPEDYILRINGQLPTVWWVEIIALTDKEGPEDHHGNVDIGEERT